MAVVSSRNFAMKPLQYSTVTLQYCTVAGFILRSLARARMSVEYICCAANIVVRRSNSLRKKFVVRPATQRRNRRHQALRSSPSPSSSPRRSSCRRRFGCSWRALGGSTPRARWGARVLLPAARDVLASPAAARRCVNRHAVTCAPSSVASALRPRCAPAAIFCDRYDRE